MAVIGAVLSLLGVGMVASQRGKPRGWTWRQPTPVSKDRVRFFGFLALIIGIPEFVVGLALFAVSGRIV